MVNTQSGKNGPGVFSFFQRSAMLTAGCKAFSFVAVQRDAHRPSCAIYFSYSVQHDAHCRVVKRFPFFAMLTTNIVEFLFLFSVQRNAHCRLIFSDHHLAKSLLFVPVCACVCVYRRFGRAKKCGLVGVWPWFVLNWLQPAGQIGEKNGRKVYM